MSKQNPKRSRIEPLVNDHSRPTIKISQRPPKSCTECIRRKTRCNKQIPCEPCLRRKVGHSCRLESQYVEPTSSSRSPDTTIIMERDSATSHIFAEIDSLRRRISDLERSSRSSGDALIHDQQANQTPEDVVHQEESKGRSSDAGTTLEYLALGMDRRLGDGGMLPDGRPDWGVVQPFRPSMVDPDSDFTVPESVTDALLPRPTMNSILAYAESHVLWQHCCLHPPSFNKEVETFWIAMSGDAGNTKGRGWASIEPTWIALLYVVLGISVHQMDEGHASRCGLSYADRLVLPNAFVAAAEDALYAGSFMTRPSLWTVQAIAILSLCGHNVCDSDLLSSLLAVGIKMAQSLGLHSLGRRSRAIEAKQKRGMDLSGHVEVSEVIDVELGKRIWWALVLEDWFAIPFRGVWAIHPDQMNTPMPFNCHSEDLQVGRYISRHDSVVTVTQKHRFSSRVAARLQQVFQELRAKNADALRIVQNATEHIERLLDGLPDCLKPPNASNGHAQHDGTPPYIPAMRHYIQISARHKLLVVNRAYLAQGGPADARAEAHGACVQNAKAILQELERGQQRGEVPMQSLWTIPYHSVAAVVVLALDMIKLGRNNVNPRLLRDRQSEIHRANLALQRLAPTSRIARRGLQVLSGLVIEINAASQDQGRRGSKRVETMLTTMKLPSNDMPPSSPRPNTEWSPHGLYNNEVLITNDDTDVLLGLTSKHALALSSATFNTATSTDIIGGAHSSITPLLDTGLELPDGRGYDNTQSWSQEDVDRILSSLQESLPDVGRLFDGSIGMF